jgi:hypothetical protein
MDEAGRFEGEWADSVDFGGSTWSDLALDAVGAVGSERVGEGHVRLGHFGPDALQSLARHVEVQQRI